MALQPRPMPLHWGWLAARELAPGLVMEPRLRVSPSGRLWALLLEWRVRRNYKR
jgi:hypothetical protein